MSNTKKIRSISEGYFHSVHASNKAEKFKLSKLSQGIESCRQAQFRNFRKEEQDLLCTLFKLTKQKITTAPESEADVLSFVNGQFDGYPKPNEPTKVTEMGPRIKVNVTDDDSCSPFEICQQPLQQFIEEESHVPDVSPYRMQSKLNVSLQSGETDTGQKSSIIIDKSLPDRKVHGRRGSLPPSCAPSVYQVESGITGQKVTLVQNTRRHSLPGKPSSPDIVNRSSYEETNGNTSSVGNVKSSHSNSFTKRIGRHSQRSGSIHNHSSEMLPKELRGKRYSLLDMEESVPFYLLRKYNHYHTNETPQEYFFTRFIKRRNALSILDKKEIENFRAGSRGSADLGTVSLKDSEDHSKAAKDVDPWEEFKKRCSALCDVNDTTRTNTRRLSISDERSAGPSGIQPQLSKNKVDGSGTGYTYQGRQERFQSKDNSMTHLTLYDLHIPGLDSLPMGDQEGKQLPVSIQSSGTAVPYQRARSNSLPSSLLGASIQKAQQQKAWSEIPRSGRMMSLLPKRIKTFPNLDKIKSLKDIDNANDLVQFNDADVIFPANDPNIPKNYTLRDYIALRKCRYLRLSKMNWASLQWHATNGNLDN